MLSLIRRAALLRMLGPVNGPDLRANGQRYFPVLSFGRRCAAEISGVSRRDHVRAGPILGTACTGQDHALVTKRILWRCAAWCGGSR
jgi:hypothetical protein